MANRSVDIGLDIGSTTIKAVVLAEGKLVYSQYRRHHSDLYGSLIGIFDDLTAKFPHTRAHVAITGSGGVSIAKNLGICFVQEVIAETEAVNRFYPDTDVIIELGGEDAKITFMRPNLEQRMNGTCAGGTGSFIDQMASLLKTDAQGLDKLAAEAETLYTIASRCGVFAKSDLQPLLNEGANKEDLAASIFQAVVNQTIAGLACGRKIQGNIVFLGGPLYFLSQLRRAFERNLEESATSFVLPDNAQLFVALGAALLADGDSINLTELALRLKGTNYISSDVHTLRPIFTTPQEKEEFLTRHGENQVTIGQLGNQRGPLFLGIDAGSTTTKAVLINEEGEIVFSHYGLNNGSPVHCALSFLDELYQEIPEGAYIAGASTTGYGENLLKTALNADTSEIETVSHYKAAAKFCPDVDFIVDIGGQDMKCMHIQDGVIDHIILNEACSSGCGSFIQTFAETLSLDTKSFAKKALDAQNPIDLGTRCTVFMNSRVKQAQKEGATVADISAGLSYSVVRNALYKVIKLRDPQEMGEKIVVQGGTFLNDAILRCFELLADKEVIRPNIAGLMGAYGAALIAQERWDEQPSTLISFEQVKDFTMQTRTTTCQRCGNHCKLTVSQFSGQRRLISGNRCEKGAGLGQVAQELPNLMDYKYQRLFAYQPLAAEDAPRGEIGIPRALNIYENYPLWFTVLTELGFRVVLSRESNHQVFEAGMDTIPSESLCYPAKLAHGHIVDLVQRGIKSIFYPCLPYEQEENKDANNHYNCPIVMSYPEVIRNNVDAIKSSSVQFISPFLPMDNRRKLVQVLAGALKDFGVTRGEVKRAVEQGFAEYQRFQADIRKRGREILDYIDEEGIQGIVLAGRPYHLDPEINHGIPKMINTLGMAVLTEDSVIELGDLQRPIRVVDQWMYHTRLYEAAAAVATMPNVQLVQLNSFGCGLDAITTDQVQEILTAQGKISTAVKIDEVNNLGAARIRMRSLQAAMEETNCTAHVQCAASSDQPAPDYVYRRREFTQEMRKTHTLLVPQMSPVHFRFIQPVFASWGYKVKVLEEVTDADVETGLKFVNNDACYPSIIVVGQLVNALLSGEHDLDSTSVVISQTGGGCRATNYVAMLRLALKQAGLSHVPVIALSVNSIEKNSGFQLKLSMLDTIVKSLVLGDVLTTVLLRTRPYEQQPGSADRLYEKWLDRVTHDLAYTKGFSYKRAVKEIVEDFNALPLRDIPRKPRVGLVGEILVKYHPDANNHAIQVIESEGCEAVLPGLLDFFLYSFTNVRWQYKHLGKKPLSALVSSLGIKLMELYRRPANRLLAQHGYFVSKPIDHMLKNTEPILSGGNICGEGWFLTAEMLELIESGVPNIICSQPFACLPNHVTGKGMIKELRRRHPEANIVPIDYDPGASEVNQLNRIKLMISSALKNDEVKYSAQDNPLTDSQIEKAK